jgi:hypothetical protein
VRLRIGAVLWFMSWIPYGVIFGLSGKALTAAWAVEIALGLIGIALAGSEFAAAVKAEGWKRAPKVAWRALVHGKSVDAVVEPT